MVSAGLNFPFLLGLPSFSWADDPLILTRGHSRAFTSRLEESFPRFLSLLPAGGELT